MKKLPMILVFMLVTTTCLAQNYLPLAPGNFWTYRLDNGLLETRVVGEPVEFYGRTVYPIKYVVSPRYEGLVNYWSMAPGGGVLLHGFTRGVVGARYEPPVLWIEGTLAVGQTWTQQSDFYILPSGAYYGRWTFDTEVLAAETRNVPAGNFACFGLINHADGPPLAMLGGACDLCGQLAPGKSDLVEYWVAQDVGIVEYLGTTPTGWRPTRDIRWPRRRCRGAR
ncbi:MAG: hypothetical protein IPK64_01145 [bacterium]|nr:hypothetical protein [bacterium]